MDILNFFFKLKNIIKAKTNKIRVCFSDVQVSSVEKPFAGEGMLGTPHLLLSVQLRKQLVYGLESEPGNGVGLGRGKQGIEQRRQPISNSSHENTQRNSNDYIVCSHGPSVHPLIKCKDVCMVHPLMKCKDVWYFFFLSLF